eukprot:scaffold102189_cov64-Attheya_sp.AAC.8
MVVAPVVMLGEVQIQVEAMDTKEETSKQEDVVRPTVRSSVLDQCYGNPDGPNYRPGFTPKAHGATCRGRGGFRGGRGGDRNDAYQNDATSNTGSVQNNNALSAASTVTNTTPRNGWGNANASGWGFGTQPATNATDNHWIDSVGAPE